MNDLTNMPGLPVQSMSSREIAELCEKRHDNVRRTIETLAEQGVIVRPQIEDEPGTDAMGRPRTTKVYVFSGEKGKRDSIVVVAQLSPEFTARLVDRWQQLEEQVRQAFDPRKALSDPAALRHLLLENVEKRIELEGQVEEMRPLVQALERIAIAEGSLCITDAAKSLQIRPKALFRYLRAHNWIYTRVGSAETHAYADKLQSGVLEHKITVLPRPDGSEKVITQARVTGKGLTRLAKIFSASQGNLL